MCRITVKSIILPVLLFLCFACSRSKELEKDASVIADAMCRSIEIMNKLKAANPQDTMSVNNLQTSYHDLQKEMENLYSDFRKKYEKRMNDPQFNKDFSNELRKAILNCPFLSKEDREKYAKEIN